MFKDYQELRDLMGCSQEELAGFFNVPRSSLALSETTERSVKSNSMQIQNRFVLHMMANKKPGDLRKMEVALDNERFIQSLRASRFKVDYMLGRNRMLLATAEKDYQKCLERMDFLSRVQPTETGKIGKLQQSNLDVMVARQKQKLSTCGKLVQHQLKLKIVALEFELSEIDKYLKA
jgi:hypothetical protein